MKFSVKYIFDFFLPRFCPGCNKKLLTDDNPVCMDCLSSILIADEIRLEDEYDRNFSSSKIIKDFYSRFVFETDKTLQSVIHALKYQKKFKLGMFLGEILSEGIKTRNWQVDLIVPVPIHPLKKVERGYNQSDYIVKGLSESLNIPYSTKLIKRTRHTESQTKLKMKERAQNVADAFVVRNPKKIIGKNILLVDDIITTGATIQECGRALVKGGAKTVYACSVGIANF
ncbi:MAG: ComF family protein [Ignavibacteriaceae bacterium]|nr:ComF family protein [Ignavibacteriaceae bacterium]